MLWCSVAINCILLVIVLILRTQLRDSRKWETKFSWDLHEERRENRLLKRCL